MGNLNRVQKRNLAIVLTSQARAAVSDWDTISKQEFDGVTPGVLAEVTAEEAEHCFGSWLRYLPNKPARDMLPAVEHEDVAVVVDHEDAVVVEPDAALVADEPAQETIPTAYDAPMCDTPVAAPETTPSFTNG